VDVNAVSRPDPWSVRGIPLALVVCAATTAVMAVPYWTADYARVRDDGIFGWFWLVALALVLGTFLAGAVSEAPLWVVLPTMLVCAPVAVVGRVVLDTAVDPTSHSLWPIEIFLAGIMSIPPTCLGVGLAWLVRRLSTPVR
jgi:hypothetical protein